MTVELAEGEDILEMTAEEKAAAAARGDLHEATTEPVKREAPKAAPVQTPEEAEAAKKASDAKIAEDAAKAAAGKKEGDEVTETPEEKAEREAEELKAREAAEAKARIRIPKHRVDEMMAKAKARESALQARIDALSAQTASAKQEVAHSELKSAADKLQDEYEQFLIDGKKAEASAHRARIEAIREQISDAKAASTSELARKTTIEELRYETALAKVEGAHPSLNPDNAELYDAGKADEVAELMEAFMAKGQTRHAALSRAVKYVMGAAPTAQNSVEDPKADAAAKAKLDADKRAEEARVKAAAAASKQPSPINKTGSDSNKLGGGNDKGIDVMRLNQAAFKKIDEETLSKLRGDDL